MVLQEELGNYPMQFGCLLVHGDGLAIQKVYSRLRWAQKNDNCETLSSTWLMCDAQSGLVPILFL